MLRWAVQGALPDGLRLDPDRGLLEGTPHAATPKPAELILRVSDGTDQASRSARLVVFQPDRPLTIPSRWKPKLPPVPWRAWMEQGFGFLILVLVHMVGMNALGGVERWSARANESEIPDDRARRRRFRAYRVLIRVTTLGAGAGLAAWLVLR
jgi:hypothetical protein